MAIVFSSCSRLQYVPNSQNVPLFEEKGEVAASLSMSAGERFFGTEFQSAYSFTDHIGLQFNAMMWGGTEYSMGSLFDIAPGYFLNVNENIVFEVYGGYGRGNIFHTYDALATETVLFYLEPIFINYDKYFIQPGIGYTMKNFDVAFSTRINHINYLGQKPLYITVDEEKSTVELKELNQFNNIEPALTVRFGWRNIKFQFQSVYAIPLDEKYKIITDEIIPLSTNIFLIYERFNFNFGLHFMFGGHFKSNRSKTSGK